MRISCVIYPTDDLAPVPAPARLSPTLSSAQSHPSRLLSAAGRRMMSFLAPPRSAVPYRALHNTSDLSEISPLDIDMKLCGGDCVRTSFRARQPRCPVVRERHRWFRQPHLRRPSHALLRYSQIRPCPCSHTTICTQKPLRSGRTSNSLVANNVQRICSSGSDPDASACAASASANQAPSTHSFPTAYPASCG